MPSEETEGASPPWGSHPHGAKGLWVLGGFHVSVGGRLDKTGAVAGRGPGDEAVGKPRSQGVCEPALEPWRREGRPIEEKPRLQTGPGKSRRPAL